MLIAIVVFKHLRKLFQKYLKLALKATVIVVLGQTPIQL